jgi:hypothetical protein
MKQAAVPGSSVLLNLSEVLLVFTYQDSGPVTRFMIIKRMKTGI